MICSIFSGHYTGKQLLPEALDQLHIILWDRAAKHYEVWDQIVVFLFISVKMNFFFLTSLICLFLVRLQTVTKSLVPAGTSFIFIHLGAVFNYKIKFQVASS